MHSQVYIDIDPHSLKMLLEAFTRNGITPDTLDKALVGNQFGTSTDMSLKCTCVLTRTSLGYRRKANITARFRTREQRVHVGFCSKFHAGQPLMYIFALNSFHCR